MRDPKIVLESLKNKAKNESYKYQRLYRNLYNPEFYLLAYSRIQANPGNMTKGTDGQTIDGMSLKRIEALIEKLRDFSYQPSPARRIYIPKSNGKMRPLGIPSFEDKLVQEVVRLILESIYEPTFKDCSHGFRPHRSCHTAMARVKKYFTGTKWFVEGDIKGCFDNVDHHVLINVLRKRIEDEQFIALIWKFLRAGYMECWEYHNTYSGTPQGSIISPILANIYLHELDCFMEKMQEEFNVGKARKQNRETTHYRAVCRGKEEKLERNLDKYSDAQIAELYRETRQMRKNLKQMPYSDPMDNGYKRLFYIRYADDFLIGVIGSKKDAIAVKEKVGKFIAENLHLDMSDEKTLITHGGDFAHFLGFDVTINNSQMQRKTAKGFTRRSNLGKVLLYVPKEKWLNRLFSYGALEIHHDEDNGNKEIWKPVRRTEFMNLDDFEIVTRFNSEIRGLYNYYRIANNVSVLNNFYYVERYSMLKTFAGKYRTHISRIIKKYRRDKEFVVTRTTAKGTREMVFYHDGFRRDTTLTNADPDIMTRLTRASEHREIIERLKGCTCEWCGKQCTSLEMHHVRKLKNLTGKAEWEQIMLGKRRKTLALCPECHAKIHS